MLFAYIALFSWPLIAYVISKRLDAQRAVAYCIMIPYLFLPVGLGIDLPGLPPISKESIASLSVFILFRSRLNGYLPEGWPVKMLLILLFLYPILTIATNSDSIFFSEKVVPPAVSGDYLGTCFANFSNVYVPFLVGCSFFATRESQIKLLTILVVLGAIYSVFMLIEVRFSPQIHKWVYGYSTMSFRQQIRAGGFRPVVFMGHGLLVAMFIALVATSALYFWKKKIKPFKLFSGLFVVYLIVVIVLCKTYSILIYALLFFPVLYFFSPKKQIKMVFLVVVAVFFYPYLRANDYIPVDRAVEFFEGINEERSRSLAFRVMQEDALLAKANERPYFGWGGWGRQRVRNSKGEDISVIDGYWIGIFGAAGWLGYVSVFGLLCVPIFSIYRLSKKVKVRELDTSAVLGILLAMSLVDLIPNSSFSQITTLLAGALWGGTRLIRKDGESDLPESQLNMRKISGA